MIWLLLFILLILIVGVVGAVKIALWAAACSPASTAGGFSGS
jgi:hypothetical protein